MTKSRTLPPATAAARIAPLLLALAGLAIAAGGLDLLPAPGPGQPVAALAPITATIAAAWGLVARATMARAEQARRAQLADYDQRCAICCCTCGPAAASFAIEPIEPGEELLPPIRYRSSNAASAIEPGRFQAVVRVNGRRPNA
jgi:hypothetical protein